MAAPRKRAPEPEVAPEASAPEPRPEPDPAPEPAPEPAPTAAPAPPGPEPVPPPIRKYEIQRPEPQRAGGYVLTERGWVLDTEQEH